MANQESLATIQYPGLLAMPEVRSARDNHEQNTRDTWRADAMGQLRKAVTYTWAKDQMEADFVGRDPDINSQWREWSDVTAIMQSDWRWPDVRELYDDPKPTQTFLLQDPDTAPGHYHAPLELGLTYQFDMRRRKILAELATDVLVFDGEEEKSRFNRAKMLIAPMAISYALSVRGEEPTMLGLVTRLKPSKWYFFDYDAVLDDCERQMNVGDMSYAPRSTLEIGLRDADAAQVSQDALDRKVLGMLRSSDLYKVRSQQIGERMAAA